MVHDDYMRQAKHAAPRTRRWIMPGITSPFTIAPLGIVLLLALIAYSTR